MDRMQFLLTVNRQTPPIDVRNEEPSEQGRKTEQEVPTENASSSNVQLPTNRENSSSAQLLTNRSRSSIVPFKTNRKSSSNVPLPIKREQSISPTASLPTKREEKNSSDVLQPSKHETTDSKREAMEKTIGYQTIIIQFNGEKESFNEVSGWRMTEKCFNCWKFTDQLAPGYQLCKDSAISMWNNSMKEAASSDPVAIKKVFDKNYAKMGKDMEFLCKQPIIEVKKVQKEEVCQNKRCEWCGMTGKRKSKYCKKCQDEIFAPLV